MNTCFLLIGGNLGDRNSYLTQATQLIMINIGRIIDFSTVYETDAWGNEQQPAYLNQVLKVQTPYSVNEVLKRALDIERQLNRIRPGKYAARTIDIDILLFNNDIYQMDDLEVPHPRMALRRFVLVPLSEIAPTYLHPVHLKTIQTLEKECSDTLNVRKYIPEI